MVHLEDAGLSDSGAESRGVPGECEDMEATCLPGDAGTWTLRQCTVHRKTGPCLADMPPEATDEARGEACSDAALAVTTHSRVSKHPQPPATHLSGASHGPLLTAIARACVLRDPTKAMPLPSSA